MDYKTNRNDLLHLWATIWGIWESQELCVLFFSLEPPNKEIKVLFYLLKYFAAISAVIGLANSSQRTEGQLFTALLSHFGLRWYV